MQKNMLKFFQKALCIRNEFRRGDPSTSSGESLKPGSSEPVYVERRKPPCLIGPGFIPGSFFAFFSYGTLSHYPHLHNFTEEAQLQVRIRHTGDQSPSAWFFQGNNT